MKWGSLFSNKSHVLKTDESNIESERCNKQRRTDAGFHVNSQGNLHRSSALTSVSLIVPLANMGL